MDKNETRTVVASIKPKYVDSIRSGVKKYELRKKQIGTLGTVVAIYETRPVGMITGIFTIGRVIHGTPQQIWDGYSECLGIGFDEFTGYFEDKSEAFAHEILEYEELSNPVSIRQVGIGSHPPQSWQRLEPEHAAQLIPSPA